MIQYRTALTAFAVPLIPIAGVMIFAPTLLGQMMGLPLDPQLARICDGHETAKMEMVRALGGWQLTLAITLLVVRNVEQLALQHRLLMAFAAAGAIHVGINLHTLLIGNISTFGWIPVIISSIFSGLCIAALIGHPKGRDGEALAED